MIFSSPMVKALLADTKSQTRRVVKPQPLVFNGSWYQRTLKHMWHDPKHPEAWHFVSPSGKENIITPISCPYGGIGDHLWVKETWAVASEYNHLPPSDFPDQARERIWYLADGPKPQWAGRSRPSIFMPRWASRITLEISDVWVERVQDISDSDLLSEGVDYDYVGFDQKQQRWSQYMQLWDTLNGKRGYPWESNPWVFVISFRVLS